jgi:hypothetical protein
MTDKQWSTIFAVFCGLVVIIAALDHQTSNLSILLGVLTTCWFAAGAAQ